MFKQNKLTKHFPILISICIVLNALGLFLDILEPDGALYASISKNIVLQNNWINLYANGSDWLDKPHLPFWFSAISFKIFGINSFAYKLPSFICFLVSLFYTFKITLKTCSKETAEIATLIYATSLHIILCNFDVRAEIFLTCFTVASVYHLLQSLNNNNYKHILIASVYTALAIMTKGIFVFITIGSGFIVYWVLTKNIKQFIQLIWYVYVVLSLLFIFPELYSLYIQFDAHPEKIVFGRTGVSGIKFFFWDSQFGRFFNTGPIQGSGNILFFSHTILWAFLPWSIFLVLAIIYNIKKIKLFVATEKTILYASALCSFILFSVSKFQLPHYIIIIFPYLAILVANYFRCNAKLILIKNFNVIIFIQIFIIVILIATITFYFKYNNTLILLAIATVLVQAIIYFKQNTLYNVIFKLIATSNLISLFLMLFFYPNLLKYQAGMMAGKWQQKSNLKNNIIKQYRCNEFSFDFYGNSTIEKIESFKNEFKKQNQAYFLMPEKAFKEINTDSFAIEKIEQFPYFHVTELTFEFLNHKTRNSTLTHLYIVKVSAKY